MPTYDPQKFKINVAGNPIGGFAEGTFIKAGRYEDAYSMKTGADGFTTRVRNANRTGYFEITLMPSSPSNDLLQALAILDEDEGTGQGPTTVKDGSGTAYASAQNSWVKKIPDLERAKELGDVTWTIDTDLLRLQQGGTVLP